MEFHIDHIRYLDHTGLAKPYFEQNWLAPRYIGRDGEANIENVEYGLDKLNTRTGGLAKDEKLKPGPTAKFDPNKSTDPTDFASKPTNPDLKTVELPLISDVWNGMEPINYHVQIGVGYPPQTFYVDLDTGSSLFWLQSRIDLQADPAVLGQTAYEPLKSANAVDLLKNDRAKYGDGDLVDVWLYNDTVTIGKLTAPAVLLGAASSSGLTTSFQMSKANGILGLGFPTDPENAGRRNLVQTLYDLRLVKHASFALIGPRVDPKLAEKIDRQVIMQPRGTFVLGSVDPAYYTGQIAWCPQIISTNRWIVKLDKITINGKVAFEDQLALIDTGSAYIIASPSNFDKTQTFIPGATPLQSKKGNMFVFPGENLKYVGFTLGGRQIRLQPQDFGLGGVTSQGGKLCSSIVRLSDWEFPSNLWVIGGIFLDNVVTIFDYDERKVGFADISEKDLAQAAGKDPSAPAPAASPPIAAPTADAAPIPATEPSKPEEPKVLASDVDFTEVTQDDNASGGREFSKLISFTQEPIPQVSVGITNLNLGSQHVRATAFATESSRDSFRLNFNATADTTLHESRSNPESDTVLRSGKAAWLRTAPNDPNFQVGRWSVGAAYPKGKYLYPDNKGTVKFSRPFASKPKVLLWIAGMDFSKAYNFRVQAQVLDVTPESFTLNVGPWGDSTLYKADVTWIAHADIPGIQSGQFSTEDVRSGGNWALQTSGSTRFGTPFEKPPKFVAALSKFEFGCGRNITVTTTTKVNEKGVEWSMDSSGDTHQYITACSYIAFDPKLESISKIEQLKHHVQILRVRKHNDVLGQGFHWHRMEERNFDSCVDTRLSSGAQMLRDILKGLVNCRSFQIYQLTSAWRADYLLPSDALSLILETVTDIGLTVKSFEFECLGFLNPKRLQMRLYQQPAFIAAWENLEELRLEVGSKLVLRPDNINWVQDLFLHIKKLKKLSLHTTYGGSRSVIGSLLCPPTLLEGLQELKLRGLDITFDMLSTLILRCRSSLRILSLSKFILAAGTWTQILTELGTFKSLEDFTIEGLEEENDEKFFLIHFPTLDANPVVPGSGGQKLKLKYGEPGSKEKVLIGASFNGRVEMDRAVKFLAESVEYF